MSLHSDLIDELLSRKTSMTPRENAAANEIERLLALLAGEDAPLALSDRPAPALHGSSQWEGETPANFKVVPAAKKSKRE